MPPIARCRRAFSLIEVLVVLALILAIIAILMPVIQWTVGQGRSVSCMDHLRQIDQAALEYSQEYKSLLPIARSAFGLTTEDLEGAPSDFGGNTVGVSFSDLVFPYLISDVSYKWDGKRVNDVHYQDHEIFQCPAATRYTGNRVGNGKINSINGQILDYGMNNYGRPNNDHTTYAPSLAYGVRGDRNHFGSSLGTDSKSDGWPHPRLSLIANPTVIYLADAEYDSSPEDIGGAIRGANEWPIRWSFDRSAYIRHIQGYSSLSLDGSARWRSGLYPGNQEWYIVRR